MRLEANLSPETLPLDDWRALWLSNPLWPQVGSSWPIGWVLEIPTGELVGCVGNVPVLYHFRGERLIGATGRGWVVLPEHRAFGSSAKLLTEHFHQAVDLVLDTSVSAQGVERSFYFASRIPAGDWGSGCIFHNEAPYLRNASAAKAQRAAGGSTRAVRWHGLAAEGRNL